MHPDISEFSYGYALTETLVAGLARRLRVAPIFPSLIEEGKSGGYDVKIPFAGTPIFLQFKLSHLMVRDSAIEVQRRILWTPFYRMHLRPLKHSQQHAMLLALEAKGSSVYYAAPYFHTPAELNSAYANRDVRKRSIFIKPSEIGTLPDQHEHHVAFKRGHPIYVCSDDPRPIREAGDDGPFERELEMGFPDRDRIETSADSAELWANRLEGVVLENRAGMNWLSPNALAQIRDRHPLRRLAYLAQTFLGCSVVVVSDRPEHA